jgi:hypothetical protein
MAKLMAGPLRSTENANNGSQGHTTNGSLEAPLDGTLRLDRQTHLDLALCFLRLANLDNGLVERIGRYEAQLWRLVIQTIVAIEMRKTEEIPAGQFNSCGDRKATGGPFASRVRRYQAL